MYISLVKSWLLAILFAFVVALDILLLEKVSSYMYELSDILLIFSWSQWNLLPTVFI